MVQFIGQLSSCSNDVFHAEERTGLFEGRQGPNQHIARLSHRHTVGRNVRWKLRTQTAAEVSVSKVKEHVPVMTRISDIYSAVLAE